MDAKTYYNTECGTDQEVDSNGGSGDRQQSTTGSNTPSVITKAASKFLIVTDGVSEECLVGDAEDDGMASTDDDDTEHPRQVSVEAALGLSIDNLQSGLDEIFEEEDSIAESGVAAVVSSQNDQRGSGGSIDLHSGSHDFDTFVSLESAGSDSESEDSEYAEATEGGTGSRGEANTSTPPSSDGEGGGGEGGGMEVDPHWLQHRSHIFILSNAGKPIFSR